MRFLQARDPEDCWQQPGLGGGEEGSFLEPRMDAQQLVLASRTERIHCLKPPHRVNSLPQLRKRTHLPAKRTERRPFHLQWALGPGAGPPLPAQNLGLLCG